MLAYQMGIQFGRYPSYLVARLLKEKILVPNHPVMNFAQRRAED